MTTLLKFLKLGYVYINDDFRGMSVQEEVKFSRKEMSNAHSRDRSSHDTNNSDFLCDGVIQMVGNT